MLFLIVKHYSKSQEVVDSEEFYLTENIKLNKAGDAILKIACIAMVLFLLGALAIFLYQLIKYYIAVIKIP